MFTMSDYYAALDAAKNAQAQQIIHFVQGFTARMVTRLHRKRDGGARAARVTAKVAAYRDSSSCFSSP